MTRQPSSALAPEIHSGAAEAAYYQRVADRLARLQALTAALARARTLTEVADVIIDQALPSLDAEVGVVAVLSEDGTALRNIGFKGVPVDTEEAWREYSVDSPVPVAEAARLREPVIVTTIAERNRRYPVLAQVHGVEQGGAVTTFPLLVDGRLLGALGFCFPCSREFDHDDLAFLQALADQCALAVERAQLSALACREIEVRRRSEEMLRESQDRLRQSALRKDEFLAMLAHELRNPLAPIRNAAEVLRQIGTSDPRISRMRDIIDRQSAHMSRIVDDLLDVSRVSRGRLLLRKAPLDLVELVRATVSDHRAMLEAAGLTLEVSLPQRTAWVVADATRLSQALANLLHNSQKFTDPGGKVGITLALDESGESVEVDVSDSGMGMAPEVVAQVFEPFMQADGTLDRSRGGLGLGLALVKGLVELHGGSVSARSAGPGRGSSFTLRLPLQSAPGAQDVAHALRSAPPALASAQSSSA
jgi:signal transduction histidine kinase